MPSHIIVNSLALTYKSTIGVSTATLPDVCKTPTPGGPVPIPYPNFANQGSLDKGTTTVKAKGKMIAIKGSEYSMSFGDEPGTVGGVTSNTFKKETEWITYSFDVKMDGQNACRNTDKKFHNHKNTVDLAGNIEPGQLTACTKEGLQKLADDCNKYVNCKDGPRSPPNGAECTTLGTKKHKCCEDAIKKHAEEHPECGFKSEVAYDKNTGKPLDSAKAAEARSAANKAYDEHKAEFGIESARANKVWISTFRAVGGSNTFIADVIVGDVHEPDACYDFKFNCKPVGANPLDRMSDKQFGNYMICTGAEPEVIACNGADVAGC